MDVKGDDDWWSKDFYFYFFMGANFAIFMVGLNYFTSKWDS